MSDETIAVKPATLTCGLIMPISQLENLPPAHWDEVKEIVTKTVEGIPDPRFTARLVSEGDDAGVIHKRIIQNVYTDDIAICDVSGRNANVMFELGMRLAFDKPTVIIKDEDTPRIFDTDVIEYIGYRRDLRYASMETFKARLAHKLVATYNLAKTDHDKQSFLKSFGTFKVVKLDEASESPDKAILSMLAELDRKINRFALSPKQIHSAQPEPVPFNLATLMAEFISRFAKKYPSVDLEHEFNAPNINSRFWVQMIGRFGGYFKSFENLHSAASSARLLTGTSVD